MTETERRPGAMRVSDMTREDRQKRLAWIESVRSPSHAYRREAEYLRLIESLEAELAAYKDAVKVLEGRS